MSREIAEEVGLSEKQYRFAEGFIEHADLSRAYGEAGYSTASKGSVYVGAHTLFKNPKIKEYLRRKHDKIDNINIAKQNEVLEFLTSVMRGEIRERVPLGVGYGAQKLVGKKPDIRDRVKAGELLGRKYGTFLERSEVDMNTQVIIVDDIPDPELEGVAIPEEALEEGEALKAAPVDPVANPFG